MIDGCAPASSSDADSDMKVSGSVQGRAMPISSGDHRRERVQGAEGGVSSRGGEGLAALRGGLELEAAYQAFELPGNIGQAA